MGLLVRRLQGLGACRTAILARVLPALMERDCPKAAWPTLQAAAQLAVLAGQEGRVAASDVLGRWDACQSTYRKAPAAVQLLREFIARAEALGVDRVYEE